MVRLSMTQFTVINKWKEVNKLMSIFDIRWLVLICHDYKQTGPIFITTDVLELTLHSYIVLDKALTTLLDNKICLETTLNKKNR